MDPLAVPSPTEITRLQFKGGKSSSKGGGGGLMAGNYPEVGVVLIEQARSSAQCRPKYDI